MKHKDQPASRLRSWINAAALTGTLLGCASGHHTTIECGDIADCADPEKAPVCAYTQCTACHPTTKKCLYRSKATSSCPCLETEIQPCAMAGGAGAPQYRTCKKVTGSSTGWGGCGSI